MHFARRSRDACVYIKICKSRAHKGSCVGSWCPDPSVSMETRVPGIQVHCTSQVPSFSLVALHTHLQAPTLHCSTAGLIRSLTLAPLLSSRPLFWTPTAQTGYSFGYGFVDYKSESDSEDAILKLNGFYVRNKRLKVRQQCPSPGMPATYTHTL